MPSFRNITFEHKELAELLVKQQGLHEGLWGVYFEFSLSAGNVPVSPDGQVYSPAGILLVSKVGLQRFDKPSNLTVDAAQVNPSPP